MLLIVLQVADRSFRVVKADGAIPTTCQQLIARLVPFDGIRCVLSRLAAAIDRIRRQTVIVDLAPAERLRTGLTQSTIGRWLSVQVRLTHKLQLLLKVELGSGHAVGIFSSGCPTPSVGF